ncbi:MAG TPA: hypothetical protein EYG21_09130 [Nitrospinaceae bacterium]|jgi:hypothetical protein|nr:hypothetical protein [Nitrospinaceae bacterium]
MVSGISGLKTDITSQIHPAGGPKSNKFEEGLAEKVKKTATTSQTLNKNEEEYLQKTAVAASGKSQDGQNQSPIVSEIGKPTFSFNTISTDRVKISSEVAAQNTVSRQSEARVNIVDSILSTREKKRDELAHPNEVQKPIEYQGEVLRNISDQTPTTGINSLARPEGSISGSGFGGYSNRAAAGLGGYAESVETTASVDQDHPVNEMGAPARIKGIEEDRPKETKPGQLESETGQTIDKMI